MNYSNLDLTRVLIYFNESPRSIWIYLLPHLHSGSKKGDNFTCVVVAVTIKAKVLDKLHEGLNLMVKLMPVNAYRESWLNEVIHLICDHFWKIKTNLLFITSGDFSSLIIILLLYKPYEVHIIKVDINWLNITVENVWLIEASNRFPLKMRKFASKVNCDHDIDNHDVMLKVA